MLARQRDRLRRDKYRFEGRDREAPLMAAMLGKPRIGDLREDARARRPLRSPAKNLEFQPVAFCARLSVCRKP